MLWIAFGLASAFGAAIVSILSQKHKGNVYTTALWTQIVFVVFCAPFVISYQLPSDPIYYCLIAANAILHCASDISSLRNTPIVGAAASSQIKRTAILITFFLWLVVSPSLLWQYLDAPFISLTILGIHILAIWFAMRIKKQGGLHWQAFRLLWVVILSSATVPIIATLAMDHMPNTTQAVFTTMFLQASIMVGLLFFGNLIRSGSSAAISSMIAPDNLRAGILLGISCFAAAALVNYAYNYADNPAYISVLRLTDTLWLLLWHKLRNEPDNTNLANGMGIVGCAAALIIIKILFE